MGIKLLFAIQKISDRHLAELVEEYMGQVLVKNPKEFLRELKASNSTLFCPNGIFGSIGEYDDHLDETSNK
ncbi:MAG: hypothetical protein KA715_07500 [Xanthomonadaceae bacterium]|nr:hypothetical protein [Xanthomonadaceae bacterium]